MTLFRGIKKAPMKARVSAEIHTFLAFICQWLYLQRARDKDPLPLSGVVDCSVTQAELPALLRQCCRAGSLCSGPLGGTG